MPKYDGNFGTKTEKNNRKKQTIFSVSDRFRFSQFLKIWFWFRFGLPKKQPVNRIFRFGSVNRSFFRAACPSIFANLRGPEGGPRPWDGQKSFLMLVLKRAGRATRCFLPDQKILFLAKVIACQILTFTCIYSVFANFNRNSWKIMFFQFQKYKAFTVFKLGL